MIPDIPQIRDSLAALTVIEATSVVGHDRQLTICKKRRRILPDDEKAIVLSQDQNAPINLSRIIDRVAEELHKQKHPYCTPKTDHRVSLASKVVGLSVAIRRLFSNPLEALNLLFEHLSEARVIQWAILVNPSTGADLYRFGDFTYGQLDLNTLRSRCERAGSDFFDLYVNRLQGRLSICRDNREIMILDANAINLPGTLDGSSQNILYRLMDEYYGEIADGEQQEFMIDLDRQQAIYGAAGLGAIPADSLLRLSALTQWITVFTRQQKAHGWVAPNQTVFEISATEPRALAEGHREITQHLKLHDWQQRPLDPWIQNFCHYVTAAQDYDRNSRVEEALLHLVFGLDLLLGGEAGESLTTVLAERVAFLSYRVLRRSLKEVSEFVRECYDLRSGYVHRGSKGMLGEAKNTIGLRSRLDLLSQTALAVLGAACFARCQEWCQEEESRYAWIKRIDVLRAKRDAGLVVDEADLRAPNFTSKSLGNDGVSGVKLGALTGLGLMQVQLREGKLPAVAID